MFLRTVFTLNLHCIRELLAGFQWGKNGNLFLDLIKKHKLSGKTVVFKSPCLVLQGSNTNTGAAGPITKARMKRKSKTEVN